MSDQADRDHHTTARIAAASFFGIVLVVFVALFVAVSPIAALVLGLVVAAVWTGLGWRNAGDVVLDLCDAEAADESTHARLFNTTAGLCTAMGVAPPNLYVVEDPAVNLLVTGTDTRSASLVVTEGALERLSVLEFEALVAFGLHRIKSGIVVPQSFVVPTFGAALTLSEALDSTPWLARLLALPAPLVDRVIAAVTPRRRDLLDDLETVAYTRSPPALASTLEHMAGHSALAVAPHVVAHLWMAPSLGTSAKSKLADLHTPLEERIAVLREL